MTTRAKVWTLSDGTEIRIVEIGGEWHPVRYSKQGLWLGVVGWRPGWPLPRDYGGPGELEATRAHLADMQVIVSASLDVRLGAKKGGG